MNTFLLFAGIFNAIAAIAHIACIIFGAPWYRFFGAGEEMAKLVEQGSIKPTIITSFIVIVLFIWSAYAFFAAAGVGVLPLTQWALFAISSIYLIRGVAGFLLIKKPLGRSPRFWFWSSIICIIMAVCHFIGLKQQWLFLI